MTYIFDGRAFAAKKEEELRSEIQVKGIIPKMVTIIVGDDPASLLYVNMKKKAAERIGAELEIIQFSRDSFKEDIISGIKKENDDPRVKGIMLQLPLPENFSVKDRDEIISEISSSKDIDGLKTGSEFVPATAKAVFYVLGVAEEYMQIKNYPGVITVVGGNGFIGSQIVRVLRQTSGSSYNVQIADRNTPDIGTVLKNSDILISVTGTENLIKKGMLKEHSIVIDVGSPKGDVDREAYGEADFVSPVPGGVGPVTISCLLENLVMASSK